MRKLLAVTLLATAAILRADTILPDSYSYGPGGTPFSWAQDWSGSYLTNGNYSASFNPPGSLGGDEMVGFNNYANITFDFGSSVTITSVTLHGIRWTGAGVESVNQITVNDTDTFAFANFGYDENQLKRRYVFDVNSSGGWTGSSLNFKAWGTSEWLMFEEITFTLGEPNQNPTQTVPDAGSSLLLCGAGLSALAILRRRLVR